MVHEEKSVRIAYTKITADCIVDGVLLIDDFVSKR
jgi:hypothetical protein